MIRWRDIIDPLIELCFEDEEMAGSVFALLFERIYCEESNEETQGRLKGILIELLKRST